MPTGRTFRPELPNGPWTREEAIAVMCRSLANLLEFWGQEGDADAVRYAESVLLRPELPEVSQLVEENARLRARVKYLETREPA